VVAGGGTGSEPLLQTQTADLGNVSIPEVNDLPLNGRRYADLALLEPACKSFYAPTTRPDRFSVNGN